MPIAGYGNLTDLTNTTFNIISGWAAAELLIYEGGVS